MPTVKITSRSSYVLTVSAGPEKGQKTEKELKKNESLAYETSGGKVLITAVAKMLPTARANYSVTPTKDMVIYIADASDHLEFKDTDPNG